MKSVNPISFIGVVWGLLGMYVQDGLLLGIGTILLSISHCTCQIINKMDEINDEK